jgi:hypothetical protein
MYLQNPSYVEEMLKNANHQFLAQGNSTIHDPAPQPMNWEQSFRREILNQDDLGKYLLNIQNSALKVDEQLYQTVMNEATASYKQQTEAGSQIRK